MLGGYEAAGSEVTGQRSQLLHNDVHFSGNVNNNSHHVGRPMPDASVSQIFFSTSDLINQRRIILSSPRHELASLLNRRDRAATLGTHTHTPAIVGVCQTRHESEQRDDIRNTHTHTHTHRP